MSTVIDFPHRDSCDRHQLWHRFERADLFKPYLALPAQGISQRQAATQLQVPRSTLQAWHAWHDTLESCPHVAEFFHSGPGLAFLHRLVFALHLVCVEVGACGMRLGCLLLNLTGLDRFVAASYGAQHQVNRQVDHALVDDRPAETARVAKDMPHTTISVTQDATCTGGLCLGAIEPVSHCMIVAQLAQTRAPGGWHARMAPALPQRKGPDTNGADVEIEFETGLDISGLKTRRLCAVQVKSYAGTLGYTRAIEDIRRAFRSNANYTCGLIVSTALEMTETFEQQLEALRAETGKEVGVLIGKELAYTLMKSGFRELERA